MEAPEFSSLPNAFPFGEFDARRGIVDVCVVEEGICLVVNEEYPGPYRGGHAGDGGNNKVPLLVVNTSLGAETDFGAILCLAPVKIEGDGGVEEVVDGKTFRSGRAPPQHPSLTPDSIPKSSLRQLHPIPSVNSIQYILSSHNLHTSSTPHTTPPTTPRTGHTLHPGSRAHNLLVTYHAPSPHATEPIHPTFRSDNIQYHPPIIHI